MLLFLALLKALVVVLWKAYREDEHVVVYAAKLLSGGFLAKMGHEAQQPKASIVKFNSAQLLLPEYSRGLGLSDNMYRV